MKILDSYAKDGKWMWRDQFDLAPRRGTALIKSRDPHESVEKYLLKIKAS